MHRVWTEQVWTGKQRPAAATRDAAAAVQDRLYRMTYGVVCFALFAIAGNIITAWSWFGTNQLGIGLHSYGFTSGVLMLLAGYVASQLLLIAAGFLLTRGAAPPARAAG